MTEAVLAEEVVEVVDEEEEGHFAAVLRLQSAAAEVVALTW